VRALLDAVGIPYTVDHTLVRGLDYYTRTAFEFIGPEENVNSTICGGGRYDGLVEAIGGPSTPGIGFGAGIERLILAIEREGTEFPARTIDVFFAADGVDRGHLLAIMSELRRLDVACDADYAGRSLKGQLTQWERTGAATLVIAGADEATIRRRGEADTVVALTDLIDTLSS
jgi:histidyl-tRNA synthetase